MANIDLRPWREERRKARQSQFVVILAIVAGIAAGVGWGWNHSVQNQIDFQSARNSYLEGKIQELDIKIKEIQSLRQQREELIDRMTVIQSLQGDRPIIVHVFDQLVRATPDGVYFTSLTVTGNTVNISARADKALTVSDFLRNLDQSEWFDSAFMEQMVAVKDGQDVVGHDFRLRITRVNPLKQQQEDDNS